MSNLQGDGISASELTGLAAEPRWKPYLYQGDPNLIRLNDEIMADRAREGRPFNLKHAPEKCLNCNYSYKSKTHKAMCRPQDG